MANPQYCELATCTDVLSLIVNFDKADCYLFQTRRSNKPVTICEAREMQLALETADLKKISSLM